MAEITATQVKELRECTGAGMMECKKALAEAGGDMEKAIDILRTKGLAALAKKAGRATNEGVIAAHLSEDSRIGALVEVNCETDFVARNADFKAFAGSLAEHVAAADPNDIPEFMAQTMTGRDIAVESYIGEIVGKLGENIVVPRFTRYELSADHGAVAVYIHGVGNIGVMVEVATGTGTAESADAFQQLARDITLQVAAAAPMGVSRTDVPADVIEHEMEIYRAQAAESGKPEQIQEKIAEGRLEKFFKEFALLEQAFVKDPERSVKQYVDQVAKDLGTNVEIVRFERMVLGETAGGK